MELRSFTTAEATAAVLTAVRELLDVAFDGDLSDDDWAHALGGWHVTAWEEDAVVAHAALVPRTIWVGQRALRAGYVEGVATAPARQGRGLGSAVMEEVAALLRERFEIGALSTGRPSFYERLGWERWAGPSFVRRDGELVRTPDEDDGLLVLRVDRSAGVDLGAAISCEARPGDDW